MYIYNTSLSLRQLPTQVDYTLLWPAVLSVQQKETTYNLLQAESHFAADIR